MSRIGRMPIPVPTSVDVAIDGRDVTVNGPKGTLALTIAEPIDIRRDDDGTLNVTRPDDENRTRALHGLSRTLVANMVTGVTDGYSKNLEIVGVGYRVQARGSRPRVRARVQPPGRRRAAGRHHVRGRDADPLQRLRHRQAEGRRGRRQHAQAAQARPVQGQGRALSGRSHSPQGRKGRQVAMAVAVKAARTGKSASARPRRAPDATFGCVRRCRERPVGRDSS